MKFLKVISFIMVLAIISCAFISCDQEGGEEDFDLPEREFYEVTVSFQIKDSTGKTVIEAIDYTYKGHAEPTILNIVDTYLSVVENWVCKIDKNNSITQIGGMKANKNDGDYWGFVTNAGGIIPDEAKEDGLTMDEIRASISVKDMSAINLSIEQINDKKDDGTMKDAYLVDGAEFTVILFVSED